MRKIKQIKYQADCGRIFSKKTACEKHEIVCKCWTNPALKTCKTCKWGMVLHDSNGMEHEPQYLHTWKQWDCKNPNFDYEKHFTPAHEKAQDLNINCSIWEQNC